MLIVDKIKFNLINAVLFFELANVIKIPDIFFIGNYCINFVLNSL